LLDSDGYVAGVLGGSPHGTDWPKVNEEASNACRNARSMLSFTEKQANHRRMDAPAVAIGVSFGGGAKVSPPGNLKQSSQTALLVMTTLLGTLAFARIAGFANCLFMAYAFQCYDYSKSTLDSLFSWNPRLRRLFKNSAWAACTVNFGPFSISYPHVDPANLCFGWCAITALGNFDPDRGGHLILWDLGLFIRFPPGATILIPSALLVHSNVPIAAHEERFLLVQYSSAGLFRWVENGFM
ncbi:hypothetical protein BT96DRAFT_769892, partial [Gymnopus androsaceus JB14]